MQILRLICTKFDFGWDSAPDPAGLKGPTSKWRGRGREGRAGKRGKGGERNEGDGR